jgi:uncharacterized protein (TIGR02996 family)
VEEALLQALHAAPNDEVTWLALADWLEEHGQEQRAELVRLVRQLRQVFVWKPSPQRAELEDRVAELLRAGVSPVVPQLTNSIGMVLSLIAPGPFRMGSSSLEPYHSSDEGPIDEVEMTRPFYMSAYPVTQAQYEHVIGRNPSFFSSSGPGEDSVKGLDTAAFPVECVSWEEAQAFCRTLSDLPGEKATGRVYHLPGEAEWEYACRGGAASTTPFNLGRSLSSSEANFNRNYPYGDALRRTSKVGSYRPNVFGLYDMHGNVWEWCEDWYDQQHYRRASHRDPTGPSAGSHRVVRGGAYDSYGHACRSAARSFRVPNSRHHALGFRVVLAWSQQ